jgi:hypothetical protein
VGTIGEFKTMAEVANGSLKCTVTVLPKTGSGAYGGCCVESDVALGFAAPNIVTVDMSIDNDEERVDVKVEETDNSRQGYVHGKALGRGSHRLRSDKMSLDEVKRFCVAIHGSGKDRRITSIVVDKVIFEKGSRPKGTAR